MFFIFILKHLYPAKFGYYIKKIDFLAEKIDDLKNILFIFQFLLY